jgi:hypothetical protein
VTNQEPTSAPIERKLVGSKELAKILRCSIESVNNLRREGRIHGYRFIRRWRYDVQEVLDALGRTK